MAWIESHQSLSRHRKTMRAVGILGIDRMQFIGHMHELWWWALDSVPATGDLGDITDTEIELGASWTGPAGTFVSAITKAGFIDQIADGRSLHDWWDYAGKLLDKRERDKKRSAEEYAKRKAGESEASREILARETKETPAGLSGTQPNQPNQPENTPPPPLQGSGPVAALAAPVEAGLPLGEAKAPEARPRAKRAPQKQDPEIKALTDAAYEAVVAATGEKPADGGWWGTVYGRTQRLAPDARSELVEAMSYCADPERPTFMATWVAEAKLPKIVTAYRNRARNVVRLIPPSRASPDQQDGVFAKRGDTPELVAALQRQAAARGEQA